MGIEDQGHNNIWDCPKCETKNGGRVCTVCKTARPTKDTEYGFDKEYDFVDQGQHSDNDKPDNNNFVDQGQYSNNDKPDNNNGDRKLTNTQKLIIGIFAGMSICILLLLVVLIVVLRNNGPAKEKPTTEAATYVKNTEPVAETTHSHTWSAWNESMKASCNQTGRQTRSCTSCGETEEREIPKTEHDWEAATWHSPSFCTVCGTVQGTANISVGDIITFGRYEQDNNLANGSESIQWQVLSVQGDRALLISSNALDAQPYHNDYVNTTWETSYIRQWLNSSFFRAAFNNVESKAIVATAMSNDSNQGNSKFTTSGGNTTNDSVFLLSYAELMEYFPANYSRSCTNTAYAASQAGKNIPGSFNSSVRTCWWWLRSPGDTLCAASTVFPDKENTADAVNNVSGCVRPAIWVDINTPDLII